MKRAGWAKGGIQRSWWNIQWSMSKSNSGRKKKVEWWGDGGKETEQADTARTNLCGSEVGSDIRQQKGAREGLRRWEGELGKKAGWFPIVWLDKVRNQRYQAELTGPRELFHMQLIYTGCERLMDSSFGVNYIGLGGVSMQSCPTCMHYAFPSRVEAHCTFSFFQEVEQNQIMSRN